MKLFLLSLLMILGLSMTNTSSLATGGSDDNLCLSEYNLVDSTVPMEDTHPCLAGCEEYPVRTYCGATVWFQHCPCPWFPPFEIQRYNIIRGICGDGGVGSGGGAP